MDKYNERKSQQGGFFSWLGGISIVEEVTTQPALNENASVDELWNRLFQYELKG